MPFLSVKRPVSIWTSGGAAARATPHDSHAANNTRAHPFKNDFTRLPSQPFAEDAGIPFLIGLGVVAGDFFAVLFRFLQTLALGARVHHRLGGFRPLPCQR